MALDSSVSDLTQVPEAFRPLYVQKDGKFLLDVRGDLPGYVPAALHAEALGREVEKRDNNIKLLKALGVESLDAGLQRATMLAALTPERLAAMKDLDPIAAKAAMDRVAALEAKGVKTGEDVQIQIKAALDAALTPLRDELAGERKARAEAQERADKALLRQSVGDTYLKAGGKASALDFIIGEASKAFHVQDNAVKALDNQFSAEKPGQPLGIDEWLTIATKKFDFAFETSKGGGAIGGGNGNGTTRQPGTFRMGGGSGTEIKTEGISILA
jgi:hypothetical protein